VRDRFDIVKGNEIDISPQNWDYLNNVYDRDEIKQMISDAIRDNDIPMPIREISEEDADQDFDDLLSLFPEEIIAEASWGTRYEYDSKYFFLDKVFRCKNKGNKASDYFQQRNRWLCDSINSPSPYRSWTIERFRLTLLNALWSLKVDRVNMATLRTCIGLRKYIASQFRPSTAKALYDHFEAKKVLDFSSGWGDRLCGFLASRAHSYFGVDPNTRLFPEYSNMIERYGKAGKKIELKNECAESVDYGDKTFDLIFTSPPYFNIERYTQNEDQSWKRHKKLENWLELFLFKSISKAWDHLEKGGMMIINISDVYSLHQINRICDPMNDFISTLDSSSYYGCIGYEMRKRPNSKAYDSKKDKFAEPMWVWEKT